MSFLPSLCPSTCNKNQQPLEISGTDQNQDSNSILPPIFIHPQLKAIAPLSLSTQNPLTKIPPDNKRMLSTPRSSRQFPARVSNCLPSNSNINSGIMDAGISVSPSIKPKPPLQSLRKRNGNARRYKNNNNIILPPLDNINASENAQSELISQIPQQRTQEDEQIPFLPTEVGDVYMGSGNDLSDVLEEEDDDEMFLRMNSGRIEIASNRIDDDIDDDSNGCYSIHIGDPQYSS